MPIGLRGGFPIISRATAPVVTGTPLGVFFDNPVDPNSIQRLSSVMIHNTSGGLDLHVGFREGDIEAGRYLTVRADTWSPEFPADTREVYVRSAGGGTIPAEAVGFVRRG